jgi:hypothetical protein
MSINAKDLDGLGEATVIGADGDKIGTVSQFYVSDATGEPTWATIKTGLFGTQETFVPLRGASTRPGELHVAFDKATVKDAPRVDADGHLTHQEEDNLYRFYNMDDDEGRDRATQVGQQSNHRAAGEEDRDPVQAPHGRDADDSRAAPADDARHRPTRPDSGDSAPTDQDDLSRRHDREQDPHPEDDGTPAADGGAVSPGETRTRMRRYVVTEHVTQTVEELPDDDRG